MSGRERQSLQPWYQPYAAPFNRKLDAAEQAEAVHLYRSGQASREDLARRFGVSLRTMHRYIAEHPDRALVSPAALRLMGEARRIGLRVTPAEAERLATAALLERAS